MPHGVSRTTARPIYQTVSQIFAILDALETLGDHRALEPLLSFVSPRNPLAGFAVMALTPIVDQRSLDGLLQVQRECPPHTMLAGQLPKAIRTLRGHLEQRARKCARSNRDTSMSH